MSELYKRFIRVFREIFPSESVQIEWFKANDPLFRAKDVLEILELNKNKNYIPSKYQREIVENGKKVQYITEPGLYRLIMKSKVKKTESFHEFVYEDILPGLRKNNDRTEVLLKTMGVSMEELKYQNSFIRSDIKLIKKRLCIADPPLELPKTPKTNVQPYTMSSSYTPVHYTSSVSSYSYTQPVFTRVTTTSTVQKTRNKAKTELAE